MTICNCREREFNVAKANREFNFLIRWLKPTAIDKQSQGRGYSLLLGPAAIEKQSQKEEYLLPSASADGKVRQWRKGFSHIFYFPLFLLFLLFLSSVFLSQPAAAQELNARVVVTAQKIRGVDQSVFTKMQKAIEQFLNSRQWTDKHYAAGERIDCRFLLDLQQNIDNDVYAGSITVQSIRPVYNASYTTTLLNYKDQDVAFRYQPFQPLVFNHNRISGNDPLVSNLTAILAYYAYIIIGLDNDSFLMNGGHASFQKAQYIVSNAPQGKYISGWKAFDGTRNRYWLAENLLNVRYKRFHQVMYQYHRQGLDRMYDHITEGRKTIADCLNLLNAMNADNPNSMILQLFFVSKSDELAGIFSEAPVQEKLQAVNLLQKLDPVNGAKYKEDLKL